MITINPEGGAMSILPFGYTEARRQGMAGSALSARGAAGSPGAGQGRALVDLGTKLGADAVLRTGSVGAAGINRTDHASFANAMLSAIDKVSAMQNHASDLEKQAIIDPSSVDLHDITIAQAEASLSLNLARTLFSRVTQAWKDLINTR
jgi:flagellar hook-basal body complex protein FliE